MKSVHTIVVKDRHGHLANWLNQTPVTGARLTVQVQGSWNARRKFRRQLRDLANGRHR